MWIIAWLQSINIKCWPPRRLIIIFKENLTEKNSIEKKMNIEEFQIQKNTGNFGNVLISF